MVIFRCDGFPIMKHWAVASYVLQSEDVFNKENWEYCGPPDQKVYSQNTKHINKFIPIHERYLPLYSFQQPGWSSRLLVWPPEKRFHAMSVSFEPQNVTFEDESPLSSSDNGSDEHTVEERRIRVPNAFLTYRTEKHLALSSQLTKAIPFPNDLSRIIACWWHEAPDETKAYYRKLAYGDDADHNPRFTKTRSC